MKQLYLIRHAKSCWKDLSLKDYDRPLNKRGKRDAPFMAKQLNKKRVTFDLILSSSALRAKKTAKAIAKGVNYPSKKIIWRSRIYTATESKLLLMLRKIDKKINVVALVGHNPQLTDFSNMLCNHHIYNIPTTGIAHIGFDVKNWADLQEKSGKLLAFHYPKQHR